MDFKPLDTRRLLASLGHDSRFRLMVLLVRKESCVSDLALEVGLSQSCTTRHLQTLARHGIVHRTRQGKRVLFRLCSDHPQVGPLVAWALGVGESPEAGHGPVEPAGLTRSVGKRRSGTLPGSLPRSGPSRKPAQIRPSLGGPAPATAPSMPASAPIPTSTSAPAREPETPESEQRPRQPKELEDYLL